MAEANKPIVLTFGGGINARKRSADIDIEECTEGENFDLDFQSSVLAPRKGLVNRATAPNGEPVRGIAQLITNTGTISTIIQAGGTVFSWDGTTTGFTEVGTVSPDARLRGPIDSNFTLDNFIIITDLAKIENVKKWNGTTFQDLEHNLGVDFKAKYVTVQTERAIFANVKTGTVDTPHVILASQQGNSEILTSTDRPAEAASAETEWFLPTPDLRPINGIVFFAKTLLFSTERGRLYALEGLIAGADADGLPFTSIEDFHAGSAVSGEEAMVNIGNDVAMGLPGRIETLRGIIEFGDVETNDASWWIAPLIDGTFGETVSTWKLVYDPAGQRVFCFPNNENTAWVLHKHLLFGPNRATGGKNISPWSKWTTAAVDGFNITAIGAFFDPTDSPALISTSPGAAFTNFTGGTSPVIFFGTGGDQSGNIFVIKKTNPPIDFLGGAYLMAGDDNKIWVSENAIDWTQRVVPVPADFAGEQRGLPPDYESGYYNGDLWLLGSGGSLFEQHTWASRDTYGWAAEGDTGGIVNSLAFGNGVWVAGNSSGQIHSSPSGLGPWIVLPAADNPFDGSNETITKLVYAKDIGTWLAVSGSGDQGRVMTSSNGLQWEEGATRALGGVIDTLAAAWSGIDALFVAVGDAGNLATSPDGVTWTSRTSNFGASNILAVAYDGSGLWCAVGIGGNIITSPDGITWTAQTSNVNRSLQDVAYFGGQWLVVANTASTDMFYLTSDDGITWTKQTHPHSITSGSYTTNLVVAKRVI